MTFGTADLYVAAYFTLFDLNNYGTFNVINRLFFVDLLQDYNAIARAFRLPEQLCLHTQ